MRILVLDNNPSLRGAVVGRLEEALRQGGVRRVELIESEPDSLGSLVAEDPPHLCFVGPGCYRNLEEDLRQLRVVFPKLPVAVVLSNEVYAAEGIELRRQLKIRVIPIADIGQMAQFILDVDVPSHSGSNARNRGVVAVTQLKGGVGGSTIANGLAASWARNGVSVALVDLDDTNPQLTDWARVGLSQRRFVSECVKRGEVPSYKVRELLYPVSGFDENLWVFGQPEHYGESFHFKADVLENAPSIAGFIGSLLEGLQAEFDVVVLDTGRSWGISTFAALPHCQKILMVTDDDALSVRRSMENFGRIHRESDDPAELDVSKWSFVLNAFTARLTTEADVRQEIAEADLFPDKFDLFVVPYSARGRDWCLTSGSFFDHAEQGVQSALCEMAFALVPFQYSLSNGGIYTRLRRGLLRVVPGGN